MLPCWSNPSTSGTEEVMGLPCPTATLDMLRVTQHHHWCHVCEQHGVTAPATESQIHPLAGSKVPGAARGASETLRDARLVWDTMKCTPGWHGRGRGTHLPISCPGGSQRGHLHKVVPTCVWSKGSGKVSTHGCAPGMFPHCSSVLVQMLGAWGRQRAHGASHQLQKCFWVQTPQALLFGAGCSRALV